MSLSILGYGLVGLVLIVVVGIPLLAVLLVQIARRKLRSAARAFACTSCGARYAFDRKRGFRRTGEKLAFE
jgi:hypothetical protein